MSTWAAFLRAVNLGSRNKVPMAGLRDVLEAHGFDSVRTYIQSGNVVFEHSSPDVDAIESLIRREFGVETAVVLRSSRQMQTLARSHPFGGDTAHTHVTFLRDKPTPKQVASLDDVCGGDEFALVGRDLVVRYPNGYAAATLTAARVEKHLGAVGTARNWRTVTRVAELMRR